jgi:hypothetical protein
MLLALVASLALAQGIPLKSGEGSALATVDPDYKSLRVNVQPRTRDCYVVAGTTGIVAAALASGGTVFALRVSPAGGKMAYIYKVLVEYTTQVAYTVPLSAIRRLGVYRGAGAATSGGTSLDTSVNKKDPATGANSKTTIALGGDTRIATTGALTITGITWEVGPLVEMPLGTTAVGTAGGSRQLAWTPGEDVNTHAFELEPGQVLGIRAGALFDAAGTWVASISVEWCEY